MPILESYNKRLESEPKWSTVDHGDDAIIIPAFLKELPKDERVFSCTDRNNTLFEIYLRNFIPVRKKASDFWHTYNYLDTSEFASLTGVRFEEVWKVWVCLNLLLAENIVFLWPQTYFGAVEPEKVHASAERADDYTETALGGGSIESIVEATNQFLRLRYEVAPTIDVCKRVIELLTMNTIENETFPEQPFIFYKASSKLILWDYLRHGAVFKALARDLMRKFPAKQIRKAVGAKFENRIEDELRHAVPKAFDFKRNIKIRAGNNHNVAWEIDIGFVIENILFLIDAKHWYKPIRYHLADATDISSRVTKLESLLRKTDASLFEYKKQLTKQWGNFSLSGGIFIMCTTEVEFITSFDSLFWLERDIVPRICTLKELIDFLTRTSISNIRNDPNFVSFLR